jgi:hypothetical protein
MKGIECCRGKDVFYYNTDEGGCVGLEIKIM